MRSPSHLSDRSTASPSRTPPRRSIVDEVADQIAFEIVAGVFPPGDRLPAVRALAGDHRINASTVQVVLARLRQAGLIEAVPRVGMVVRDVARYGGIETWHYFFRFSQRLPDKATRIFADFLTTRLVLLFEVVRLIAADCRRYDPGPVRRAVEQFELLAGESPPQPLRLAQAELRAARAMILPLDHPVILAVFNSIVDILMQVPAVVGAMYADPAFNLSVWHRLLDKWERGTLNASDIAQAEAAFRQFNAACLERFRGLLQSDALRRERASSSDRA
ncbi:MAG: GntR family transcriptional regulator [Candidatus Schekmanbacteria bacterium]|nr:GntR family transcriptional regulator [Candidatus Schekmanbacteria bacterium]